MISSVNTSKQEEQVAQKSELKLKQLFRERGIMGLNLWLKNRRLVFVFIGILTLKEFVNKALIALKAQFLTTRGMDLKKNLF